MLEDILEELRSISESLRQIADSMDDDRETARVDKEIKEEAPRGTEEMVTSEGVELSEEQLALIQLARKMGRQYLINGSTVVVDKSVLQAFNSQ